MEVLISHLPSINVILDAPIGVVVAAFGAAVLYVCRLNKVV